MARIQMTQADIPTLEVDAIANAANTELEHGGGVAAAIAHAGGPTIQLESNKKALIAHRSPPSRWAPMLAAANRILRTLAHPRSAASDQTRAG